MLTIFVTALSIAAPNQGLPPPEPHPLCVETPADPEVERERVLKTWPDGSTKAKQINFVDGTYAGLQYHENGNLKLESHHTKVLIDGDPRRRRHVKHGTHKQWHANGQLGSCRVYVEGKKEGTWISYREDGTAAAAYTYENDREVEHLTYSTVFGWQPFGG